MQLLQLNTATKKSKPVSYKNQISLSPKSDMREGMSSSEMANVISNNLIAHVEKAVSKASKEKAQL
jgi:hypothetical protein